MQYRDNNNFIKLNTAKSSDSRNPLVSKSRAYYFLNSVANPIWIGKTSKQPENITDDGGLTWKQDTDELLFGSYFFLSEM